MSILSTEDSINHAMIMGLRNAFRTELKSILMEVAEGEIDFIVKRVSERIDINATNWKDFRTLDNHIKLEWILTKKSLDKQKEI